MHSLPGEKFFEVTCAAHAAGKRMGGAAEVLWNSLDASRVVRKTAILQAPEVRGICLSNGSNLANAPNDPNDPNDPKDPNVLNDQRTVGYLIPNCSMYVLNREASK